MLPMIGTMVRSIRRPEQRAGLAALVRVIEAHPSLSDTVRTMLPELDLDPEEAEHSEHRLGLFGEQQPDFSARTAHASAPA